jgi:hypothetical protein
MGKGEKGTISQNSTKGKKVDMDERNQVNTWFRLFYTNWNGSV